METEHIDKLFLELSQFTKATTKREADLTARLAAAEAREQELRMELAIEKAFNTDTELYYRLLAKRDEAAKGGRDE